MSIFGTTRMRFPLFTSEYIIWAYQLFRGRDVEFIEGIEMLPWWEIQSIGKYADHRTDFRNTIIERRRVRRRSFLAEYNRAESESRFKIALIENSPCTSNVAPPPNPRIHQPQTSSPLKSDESQKYGLARCTRIWGHSQRLMNTRHRCRRASGGYTARIRTTARENYARNRVSIHTAICVTKFSYLAR